METFFVVLMTLVVGFVVASYAGQVTHWAFHQSWSNRFHQAHMTHHIVLYPVTDYLSDTYRSAGKDNSLYLFLIVAIPFFLLPLLLFWLGLIPFLSVIVVISEMIIIGWIHEFFHTAFHIRNHVLKRYAFFRRLTDIHFVHHLDMQTNFGIFFFGWDRLLGTYKNPNGSQMPR